MPNQTHRSARIKSEMPAPDDALNTLRLVVPLRGSSRSVGEFDRLDGARECSSSGLISASESGAQDGVGDCLLAEAAYEAEFGVVLPSSFPTRVRALCRSTRRCSRMSGRCQGSAVAQGGEHGLALTNSGVKSL